VSFIQAGVAVRRTVLTGYDAGRGSHREAVAQRLRQLAELRDFGPRFYPPSVCLPWMIPHGASRRILRPHGAQSNRGALQRRHTPNPAIPETPYDIRRDRELVATTGAGILRVL
jgi:hypothetical protein